MTSRLHEFITTLPRLNLRNLPFYGIAIGTLFTASYAFLIFGPPASVRAVIPSTVVFGSPLGRILRTFLQCYFFYCCALNARMTYKLRPRLFILIPSAPITAFYALLAFVFGIPIIFELMIRASRGLPSVEVQQPSPVPSERSSYDSEQSKV